MLRIVHERATSIDLNPELEETCLDLLMKKCGSVNPGEVSGWSVRPPASSASCVEVTRFSPSSVSPTGDIVSHG